MPDAVPIIPLLPAFLSVVAAYSQELLVGRELGERTCKNMRQTAVQCLLFLQQKLGVKQLERVEPQHLEAFFRHLEACQYTAVTQQRKLKEVKTFFAWLKEAGHIPHEPAAGIVLPPARPPAMRCLSTEEIEQLLAVVDNTRDKALLYLLLHTGITLSEVHRLNLADVVLADSQSVVGRSYLWATGRRDKRRLIQLDDKTSVALAQWLDERPWEPTEAAFVSQKEQRLSRRQIQYIVEQCGEQAGLEGVNVKALRSTFAAYHLQSNIPVEFIQEVMGIKLTRSMRPYLAMGVGR